MTKDCTEQADLNFSASAGRGGGRAPTVNLHAISPKMHGFFFSIELTYEQALLLRDAVEGAIFLIEDEQAEAAGAVRH